MAVHNRATDYIVILWQLHYSTYKEEGPNKRPESFSPDELQSLQVCPGFQTQLPACLLELQQGSVYS